MGQQTVANKIDRRMESYFATVIYRGECYEKAQTGRGAGV